MELIEAIRVLVSKEPDLESALDLLTEIGLTANGPDTFRAAENVRNELVEQEELEELLK